MPMDTGLAGSIGSWADTAGAYEASYSGTLQQGTSEALLIPVRTFPTPGYYSSLKAVLQSAQSGVTVTFTCLKNGSSIGTVTITTGNLSGTSTITSTLISAEDKITWTITWTGVPTTLGITATMRLTR